MPIPGSRKISNLLAGVQISPPFSQLEGSSPKQMACSQRGHCTSFPVRWEAWSLFELPCGREKSVEGMGLFQERKCSWWSSDAILKWIILYLCSRAGQFMLLLGRRWWICFVLLECMVYMSCGWDWDDFVRSFFPSGFVLFLKYDLDSTLSESTLQNWEGTGKNEWLKNH